MSLSDSADVTRSATRRFRSIRRSVARALCAALILGLYALPAAANTGKYAAEFLRIGVGARALGMGGAFWAIADDGSAAYWNPAGLSRLQKAEMLFMHAEQFGSLVNHDYLSFVQPLRGDGRASSVGISLVRLAVDNIQVTRDAYEDLNQNGRWDQGEPILPDRFYLDSDTEYALFLSYGREVRSDLSLGGNLKMIRQGLLNNTSFGMGIDLGALYRPMKEISLGARVADVTTTRISWDTGHKETILPTVSLGAAWTHALPALNGTITAGLGLASTFSGRDAASQVASGAWGGDLQAGLEYWYGHTVAARIGSDSGSLTAGAGLRGRGLGADYAYLSNQDLDATHRVSASVRF